MTPTPPKFDANPWLTHTLIATLALFATNWLAWQVGRDDMAVRQVAWLTLGLLLYGGLSAGGALTHRRSSPSDIRWATACMVMILGNAGAMCFAPRLNH